MPASVTPKFQSYNAAKILDGTGTPLEYEITQWQGVFSWTEPEPAALVAYNQNEFAAVVSGQKQVIALSFTVNLTQFTIDEATFAELLDVLNFRALWAAAVSTAPASFSNFNMVDIEFTMPGVLFGEQADATKTFSRCRYVSHAVSPGDPNTMVITLECYGGTTPTGQVIP